MKEISPDKLIAHGRTADVYVWDDGHVLKLFKNWFDLENIEYELRIARAVHDSGVQTPAVLELIQINRRHGLIYERARGISMLGLFRRKPWKLFTYARLLAGLQAQMHERIFDADVPTQRQRLQYEINQADILPASLKNSLLKVMDSLPEDDRLCHGDFHPDNIMISGNDAIVIDWIDASRGNPLADVARTSIILRGAVNSKQIPNLLAKLFVSIFHGTYLREYFRLRPGGKDEYQRWLPIVAGARLNEEIPELEEWLVMQAEKL